MAEISRSKMFGKLTSVAYRSMESATVFCKMRGNPYVEIVHWIHQVLTLKDSDIQHLVNHYKLDNSRLAADLTRTLDELPRGATSIRDFSDTLQNAVKEGWLFSSLLFNKPAVRSGHIIVSLLKISNLRKELLAISHEFSKIDIDDFCDNFDKVLSGSPEETMQASDGSNLTGGVEPGETSSAIAPAQMGKQEALKQFTQNLTESAKLGKIDNIVGRDDEIRQIIDILMRRRQNNPILTGEAGVGKTAVVEGFAVRIAKGDVPPPLRDVQLHSLDLGLLQAGASMKGEFEERLKSVIEEVQSSDKPVILFIDEAHTLIGAGGSAGQGDAANLLKPALARGELRTIAATTWSEYKKYFEKDPALTRRFQNILVEEPDDNKGIQMMRGISKSLQKHHKVQILDEALEASVILSRRYIPGRQLPDKSVSVLDTASARVAVSHYAEPIAVENSRRTIEALKLEIEILEKEEIIGEEHSSRLADLEEKLTVEKENYNKLKERWLEEKNLVEKIVELKNKLKETLDIKEEKNETDKETSENNNGEETSEIKPETINKAENISSDTDNVINIALTAEEIIESKTELKELENKLEELQGETPLILPSVGEAAIASVIADWTGIPLGNMVSNQITQVLKLADTLKERVVGQDHALEAIAKRIQTSRASLEDPNKPIGVFLLAGTSGTGKTETALALAEALYGGEDNLITINMSEFQEAHTVSTLKGAPPGYVGYGEGGVLTEAVRRRPYSVVLLDEIEKAHPDVHEIFFQVFDKGRMEDGEGRLIDFRNTVIIMTSNAGSDLVANMCKDPEMMPDPDGLAEAMHEPLLKVFPAALLGRLVTIPFFPLSDEVMNNIITLKLQKVIKRIKVRYNIPLTYSTEVLTLIRQRCNEVESGARVIDGIITNTLLPEISRTFLNTMLEGKELISVDINVKDDEFNYKFQ